SSIIDTILDFFAILPDSDEPQFSFNFSQVSFSSSFSFNLQTIDFGGAVDVDLPSSDQDANVRVGGFKANGGYNFSGQSFSGGLKINVPDDTENSDPTSRRVFSFKQFQASADIEFSAFAIALPFDIDSELPLDGFLGAGGDIVELVGDVLPDGVPELFGLGGGGDFFADLRGVVSDLFLNGNAGDDNVTGGSGNDTINGGADNDTVSGGAGDDTVSGERGDDTVSGGDGNDMVNGGDGDDRGNGDGGYVLIDCYAGVVVGFGGGGNDRVNGGRGNDRVNGNQGDDEVMGGDDDDVVNGGKGNDMLMGGNGNDVLSGDMGDDMLMGGAGGDRCDYGLGRGIDTIVDFDPLLDKLGINGLTFAQLEIREVQIGLQINTEVILGGDEGSKLVLQNTFAAQVTQSSFTFFGASIS
ncbi:MAG: calcium-binding protein, partial [Cyanophyceae cyanobacterium]